MCDRLGVKEAHISSGDGVVGIPFGSHYIPVVGHGLST